ncbi:MAG TPA: hypothetical protein VGP72_01995 [Planctomycetota bacterium]|jgi:hypothetical protein
MKARCSIVFAALLQLGLFSFACAEEADSVSQYGITWKFDKLCPVGKFITGDYWVVGPVTVVSVTPSPGSAPATEPATEAKSLYGAAGLRDDRRMRNGSMIVRGPANDGQTGFSKEGYDSRVINYDPALSVPFPCKLDPNDSLISTISSENYVEGKLVTPCVVGQAFYLSKSGRKAPLTAPTSPFALESAAVLTCLAKAPPADAFRPPYAGKEKPIYQAKDLQWSLLPKLKPVPAMPDFEQMARIFERPWLDHMDAWTIQFMAPGLNQPNYGREFARMTSYGALMLLLDVPQEKKQALMYGYVQLGIDLSGVAKCGRQWFGDGGHWQGRKWPILFASIMLDRPEIREFPLVSMSAKVYGGTGITPTENGPQPTTIFQEDLDTYFGNGGDGQTALWQAGCHTGPREPFEEKPKKDWDKTANWLFAYHAINAQSSAGNALAALLMKAKAIWNHDAFFEMEDYWMGAKNTIYERPKWIPEGAPRTTDPFFDEMWSAYRKDVPRQRGGKDNLKWVWNQDKRGGHFVQNPPEK